ncbi:dihydroorotate dehydrogenase electron transfer subunit [bacterium]|nr:dihydroorotate dehydrogenase electron transfer subunit [bacterium]
MINNKYPVVDKIEHSDNIFELVFSAPYIADQGLPGEFVNVKVNYNLPHPFLRRPFSLHDVSEDGKVSLLIKVVGAGTRKLQDCSLGDEFELLGPVGKPFTIPDIDCTPVLVAGGIGIAPIYFLLKRLVNEDFDPILFLGAKTSGDIIKKKELISTCNVHFATEDGSFAKEGFVSDLLLKHDFNVNEKYYFYSCGPKPMLKKIGEFAIQNNFECEVSLEENFGCGIGACYGCSILTKDGYKRICRDGPVFNIKDVFEFL